MVIREGEGPALGELRSRRPGRQAGSAGNPGPHPLGTPSAGREREEEVPGPLTGTRALGRGIGLGGRKVGSRSERLGNGGPDRASPTSRTCGLEGRPNGHDHT